MVPRRLCDRKSLGPSLLVTSFTWSKEHYNYLRAGGVCCNSSLAYLVTVVFTNIVHINRLSAHPEIT